MEINQDSDADREFDHALLPATATEVLRILRSFKGINPRAVFSDITRRLEWIEQRRIFLTANGSDTCMAWTAPGDTELLKRLSEHLSQPVRWVYVDEATRSWAYLEYRHGRLEKSILDPRPTWERGTVSGEVLMGRGDRSYASLADFFQCIQDRYTPPDTQWSYPAWVIVDTRESFLRSPQVFAWAIEFAFETNGTRIAFHGPVPEEFRLEMQ